MPTDEPRTTLRVAAFQFDVRRGATDENLARVEEGLRTAAGEGIELVVLPEMWSTSFVGAGDDAEWLRESERAWAHVHALAAELDLAVCGSGFGAAPRGAKLRNRWTLADRGEVVLEYDKVHLFSPSGEPLGFSGGELPPETTRLRGVLVSGVTCYDLRFGPVLRGAFEAGAELLLMPAQWPDTRASHWRALALGRAVEHQAFVVATNRTGRDLIGRRDLELSFPGNSLVVSPHARVLAEGRGQDGLVAAELDLEELRELRRRVPVRRDERAGLYARWGG